MSFDQQSHATADAWFAPVIERRGTDAHLKAGQPPLVRVAGALVPTDGPALAADQIAAVARAIMPEPVRAHFEAAGNADFAYTTAGGERFRVNVYRQRGCVSVAARHISGRIPTFQELHLPQDSMRRIAESAQGLVLFAGVRGTGKSTSIAACLGYINERRRCHILTLEDPIEYVFEDRQAFVNQREIGLDVPSYAEALRNLAREDPDVVLVGEIRDADTCLSLLRAAESSRLVFSTVHAPSAPAVIARLVELFPDPQRQVVREVLATNLTAVVCQKLLPSLDPNTRLVPATEVLVPTATLRKMIRDGDDAALADQIAGGADLGMHDFTQDLARLVKEEWVDPKTACEMAPNAEALRMMLRGIDVKSGAMR
jgi:twitching motility protein PilT